ncbi:hypothetical protein [Rhizobium laguerreae]|uniref:hypothetical protein n=1 Tax=Rhizobium laguerreae TaxID=1076926 RepID=UPI001C914EC5|nr:hypothetical protein [Rhizobium laguerreae]MBY3356052.1 hypothetical protein [Rhizobium laguerreae]MBY3377097.1 hypothetical protein [Rhizobium laguerreae]MBY3390929.1 hypothetical protein [Rhizobium laguerreae]MBY3404591.1 hypothetical protein [Rhizobium laguerreae]MBY3411529.1 hypothetical protein [Rhizobium laguerreae]
MGEDRRRTLSSNLREQRLEMTHEVYRETVEAMDISPLRIVRFPQQTVVLFQFFFDFCVGQWH